MPAIMMCAGTQDLCYHCNQPGNPGNPLRKCGRCRFARYCSAACQTSDWRNHKQVCMDHKANLQTYADSTMEQEVKIFSKWIDAWRNALEIWGTFAADLANQSPDFLSQHRWGLLLFVAFRILVGFSASTCPWKDGRTPGNCVRNTG